MNVTCPSCGAEMDLDVLLAHEDSRQAMARLVLLSVPLGRVMLQYLRLFKPATRQLGHGRVVRLIEELLPDIERGAVTHKGRDWPAPRELWQEAVEKMLAQRDALTLPMKSHGYLYEVIVGLADKAEAAEEREREEERRARPATEGVVPAATVLQPPTPAPAYTGPSPYAQRLKAEMEARKARSQMEGGDA